MAEEQFIDSGGNLRDKDRVVRVLRGVVFAGIIGVIVLYMHRENIKRLINGTEHKFGQKK